MRHWFSAQSLVLLFILFGPDLAVRYDIDLPITQFVALGLAVLLAAAPLFACSVQTISRDRQTAKLDDVIIEEMKNTSYFQLARSALTSLKPASINDPDYLVPLTLFSTIISFLFAVDIHEYLLARIFEEQNIPPRWDLCG